MKEIFFFRNKIDGRILGELDQECKNNWLARKHYLFDMPSEHNNVGVVTWSTKKKRAEEWIKYICSPDGEHILDSEIIDGLKDGNVEFEIVRFVEDIEKPIGCKL